VDILEDGKKSGEILEDIPLRSRANWDRMARASLPAEIIFDRDYS
jgi:hypothetical protein